MNKTIIYALAGVAFYAMTAYFWSHYYIQSPIKRIEWQCVVCSGKIVPVKETPKKSTVSPVKASESNASTTISDKEIILAKKNGLILWNVYGLESTWGKKDGCKTHGEFNGFGYGQNLTSWNCFKDFQTVVDKVDAWFTKNMNEDRTLDQVLCLYNTGILQPMCSYSIKYHSL